MGIDIEKMGIGLIYKAGDYKDLNDKMEKMINFSEGEIDQMKHNIHLFSFK